MVALEQNPDRDIRLMQECISLALKAEGRTSPNPMVGAVVTDTAGATVGRGYHPVAGQPHGEVFALEEAGTRARGGTLYVSLEPCCHYGRTPPCLDHVMSSGVARVVIGMIDPNPQVGGKSVEALRAAGIATTLGVCESECRWLNRGFVKRMTVGLPRVALKLATTMDGRIADRTGSSRWISGSEARLYVHQLRNIFDAVMVGPGTALKDDPELTVRGIENGRNPIRIVFDPDLRITPQARMCKPPANGEDAAKTLILCRQDLAEQRQKDFASHVELIGIEYATREKDATRPVGIAGSLRAALIKLMPQPLNTILCEGGGRFAALLLSERLVDEVYWIVAPKMLVDGQGVPSLGGIEPVALGDCVEIDNPQIRPLGRDVLISGSLLYKPSRDEDLA